MTEDEGNDLNGVSVNDLAMSKSASTWGYDDARAPAAKPPWSPP